jgi:hypothetical protein
VQVIQSFALLWHSVFVLSDGPTFSYLDAIVTCGKNTYCIWKFHDHLDYRGEMSSNLFKIYLMLRSPLYWPISIWIIFLGLTIYLSDKLTDNKVWYVNKTFFLLKNIMLHPIASLYLTGVSGPTSLLVSCSIFVFLPAFAKEILARVSHATWSSMSWHEALWY